MHTSWLNIALTLPCSDLASHNLLVVLDEHTAVAASGVEAIAELVTLDVVFFTDFDSLDELNAIWELAGCVLQSSEGRRNEAYIQERPQQY